MDARIDKNRIYCNCLLTILGSEQWTPNAGGDYEENNLKKIFYKWTIHFKAYDLIGSLKSPFCQATFKQYFTNFNSNKD